MVSLSPALLLSSFLEKGRDAVKFSTTQSSQAFLLLGSPFIVAIVPRYPTDENEIPSIFTFGRDKVGNWKNEEKGIVGELVSFGNAWTRSAGLKVKRTSKQGKVMKTTIFVL
jgi:hypothetical protein